MKYRNEYRTRNTGELPLSRVVRTKEATDDTTATRRIMRLTQKLMIKLDWMGLETSNQTCCTTMAFIGLGRCPHFLIVFTALGQCDNVILQLVLSYY